MLEESISCSPGHETKRSQSRLLHKRIKGRHRQPKSHTASTEVSCLESLYAESNHILDTTHYEHFNPFENEKLLAAADMVRVPKPSTSRDLSSRGFVKLNDLPMQENDDFQELDQESTVLNSRDQTYVYPQVQNGPETQFGITESEFIRFCEDAEMDIKEIPTTPPEISQNKKSIVETILEDFCSSSSDESSQIYIPQMDVKEHIVTPSETPQNKKSIVDTILEDFCASPYSESPPKFIAEDATPIFRFRTKSIRTYAGIRRKRLGRNIENELANAHLTDDDGDFSDSSGLSVQEDLTQNVVPELDTVDLNSSIRVCENLLNLSSYFSQTTSNHEAPQSSEEQRVRSSLSDVVEEIIQLRRTAHEITRRKSADEFYGFSDEENKSKDETFKELLEAEDDIIQQINCDSFCYDKVQPKVSFSYDVSELEIDLGKAKSVIEDAKKFMQSLESRHDADARDKSLTTCDSQESLPSKLSQASPVKDEKLFEEIDLWNDNEYLLNYVTQKPNLKQTGGVDVHIDAASAAVSDFGFSTASKKPVVISELANSKFEQLAKEGERKENGANAIFMGYERVSNEESPDHKACCLGFTTASKKPVVISEEASLKADQILKQFEQEEREKGINEACSTSTILKDSTYHEKPPDESTREDVKFFSSAANVRDRKSNEVSDEVKQKAEELLKDIEFFEEGFEEDEKAEEKSLFNACIKKSPAHKSAFEGFKTASRKPIQISDDAKRRADQLIRDIQTEEIPEDFLECIQADLKHGSSVQSPINEEVKPEVTFEGFKTASKKPIQISEVGKRRAEQIFKELATDDLPQEFLACIQADLNEDEFSNSVSKEQGVSNMNFEGFKTASKKSIKISDVARQRAEQMLKEIETADLPQDFLKCIETDLKDDSALKSIANLGKPLFEGFKTASRKPIQISDAAKQRAEQLLKEVDTNDLHSDFIECIQSNFMNEDSTKVTSSCLEFKNQFEDTDKDIKLNKDHSNVTNLENEVYNVCLQEAPLNVSPQKTKEPEYRKTIKRKSEVFHSDESPKSPKRRFSCNERTPLNRIENAPLHKTASHPEIKPTQKISKKNLLSLSKRKKYDSSKAVAPDLSLGPKTPEKSHSSPSRCNANTTPNLKEFFERVTTSTPLLIRTSSCKVEANPKDSSIDADFQKINWENASNSARVCKTSSFTDLNVTCVEVSPSPKQRIERLKMYGEPPPISPILMVNKCRPSGLRRGRSLMKP